MLAFRIGVCNAWANIKCIDVITIRLIYVNPFYDPTTGFGLVLTVESMVVKNNYLKL